MGAEARANIAVTIGDVNLGPGATAILGMNKVGSDFETQEKTIQRCKNELFVSEPRSVRAELINTKGSLTEGTCRWIRHNEIYRSWLDAQESGLLWISGRPGRGKTMLSIFLTREWESLPDHVLYVFCGDKSTSDEVTIMRSLLYQVLDQAPSMVNHVEDCLGTEERTKRTLSSRGDLWAMFTSMLKDPKLGPVLGLIDGLDECQRDSTRWLLNNLRQVFDKGSRSTLSPRNPFKLAIVSRDMVGLRSFPQLNLETKTDAIARDVYRVIDAKMKEHDLFSELDDGFIKEVKTALWDHSDGTFLWVGFAIQELLSVETKTEMRIALDAIPQDLGALYSKILLRIKGPMREKIAQLLRWVTLACHSLTVDQLAEALDVDAQTIVDLVAMSGSLLTLGRRIVWDTPTSRNVKPTFSMQWRNKGAMVKLVHASVGEFLKGEANNDILRTPEFRIEVEEMEFHITQRCLSVLEASLSRSLVRDDMPVNTLSSYATFSWPEHARRCGERLERLLDSDNAFVQRLLPLAQRMLRDTALTGKQVDDLDYRGWSALCYALDRKHAAVAQLLVDHGASLTRDFEKQKWLGNTEGFKPIHKAMELGAEVAEPFLKKALEGISPNPLTRQPPFRSTALEHNLFRKAATLGDERLIRIMIASGATLDSDVAQLALKDALEIRGGAALIELLLQQGASHRGLDPTMVLRHGAGPVYGQVKALLDDGMDPNSGSEGRPLLHWAVAGFGSEVAELLLDYGAHINAQDDYGKSALVVALAVNNMESASMLLERGVDMTIKDKYGDNALHWAIKLRRPRGTELLLQHGMDVNIQDKDGRTALASVLENWDLSTAELLVEHGACIDGGGGRSNSLEPGEDAGEYDIYIHPSSFLEAVWEGSVQIVRFLLRHGADANARVGVLDPTTPLRAAILNRHVDMVKALLEHGADPNRALRWSETPLYWNQGFDDEERAQITELLLQKGGRYGRGRMRRPTRLWDTFV
ncbi:hypothetical protein BHE90_006875 [Fusarium euwallaceae]|uniref:Nephrocystin 3-like N-terminal domain-containing protein n=1 Tax=Fusarium euwallaceae TaxID=1147111 RepID=A0A430LSE8_9HYPO|nr:hypothetical protein BHE90_006875 [Fusarium euwallaceae]